MLRLSFALDMSMTCASHLPVFCFQVWVFLGFLPGPASDDVGDVHIAKIGNFLTAYNFAAKESSLDPGQHPVPWTLCGNSSISMYSAVL